MLHLIFMFLKINVMYNANNHLELQYIETSHSGNEGWSPNIKMEKIKWRGWKRFAIIKGKLDCFTNLNVEGCVICYGFTFICILHTGYGSGKLL